MGNHLSEYRVTDVVFEMRCRGIKLWTENDQLHYQADSGALTPEDKKKLLSYKSEIIAFLKNCLASDATPLSSRPSSCNMVPLAPFQRWVWRNWCGPDSGRSVIATRITGRINIELLRRSFTEIVCRHEALRTGVVFVSGMMQQEIREKPVTVLQSVECPGASVPERERKAKELVEELANEKFDFSRDLLFDAKVIELDDQNWILIMRIHALISDATSRKILWREIWQIYMSYLRGQPVSLPKILQPGDVAVWHEVSNAEWTRKHGEYWETRLAGAERLRLFPITEVANTANGRIESLTWEFGLEVTRDLRVLSRQTQTSLGMVVLAIWIASIMRWCKKKDVVVSFQTTGRLHVETENTIGSFICPLFLRLELQRSDTFHDFLIRVIGEYDSACRNYDFGRLIARSPEADFSRNPCLNWGPKGFYQDAMSALNEANQCGIADPVCLRPFEFSEPLSRDNRKSNWEPRFALVEVDNDIKGLMLRSATVSAKHCEKFADDLCRFAGSIARKPLTRVLEASCT